MDDWTARTVLDLVRNAKDRFSPDGAHMISELMTTKNVFGVMIL